MFRLIEAIYRNNASKTIAELNFSAKLQIAMMLITALSFFVIGYSTYTIIKNQFTDYNKDMFSEKTQSVELRLKPIWSATVSLILLICLM